MRRELSIEATGEWDEIAGQKPAPSADESASIVDGMTWRISERSALKLDVMVRLGSSFLVGNGYLGYRGTLEEYTHEQKVALIVSGLYDKVGDSWREPVNIPNPGYLRLEYQSQPLHALSSDVASHEQTLDLRQAVHERRTTFMTGDGCTIAVSARRFASLVEPHLICFEYTVEASQPCTLRVVTGIDGEVWDLNGPHLEQFESSFDEGALALTACTHERLVPIAVVERLTGDDGLAGWGREEKRIWHDTQLSLAPGEPHTLTKIVAVYTALESADPLAEAQRTCRDAAEQGFDVLLAAHVASWDERWRDCGIEIDGDDDAQLALRFSMYHLLSVAPTHAQSVSIPARGLSGQVYKGAVFWDTEIFMLPFFTHTFPEIARNLLLYRYHTLDGARRKAREYGFRGAFYAWESQDTGDDACTLFNVTDVFTDRPMRTYFRDKQYHISADVAYAIWDYYAVTGDDSVLLDGGAEIIYECARFYLTCSYYNHNKGRYEILDVTGPDEYHERVNNNAYTNWMAAHCFDVCLQVDEHLQQQHPVLARALLSRLDFQSDLETIRQIAPRLYRPEPDPQTSLVPQFDGYMALEDVSLPELLGRKLHPHEYLGGGNGLATTTQIVKQADVVLGLYLFRGAYSRDIKAANWEFYEPRTEHGSSLSSCAYSLVASEIGRIDSAYDYFMKTASIDLDGNGKQYVGTLYIAGTHPAANGGAWMSAVLGLCGIRCSADSITVAPSLPRHWSRVRLPLTYRGQKLVLTIGHDEMTVEAVEPLAKSRIVVHDGEQSYTLPETGPLTISLPETAALS